MPRKSKAKRAAKAALKAFASRRGPPPRPPVVLVQQKKKSKKRRNRNRQGAKPLNSNLVMKLGKTATAIAGGIMPWTKPIVEAGVDFLATLTGGGSDAIQNSDGTFGAPGVVVANYTIAPGSLSNTRLQLMSQLYQRYFFNKVEVQYIPAVGVTQSGQMIGYFDTDPEDTPPSGLAAINYANAHGGVLFQISEPAKFLMPVIKDRTYYTSTTDPLDEERFKIQAIFRVIQVTTLPSAALGSFSVDYNCTMELPAVITGAGPLPPTSYYTASMFTVVNGTSQTGSNLNLFNTFSPQLGEQPVMYSTQYATALVNIGGNNMLGYSTSATTSPLCSIGYYDLYFSVNFNSGTGAFPTPTASNSFLGTAGGFTLVNQSIHYTTSAAGDIFMHWVFQVTSGSGYFSPIATLSSATSPIYYMLLFYSPTTLDKKLHQSNISRKIDEIDSRIEKLDMLINSVKAMQRPFSKSLPPLDLGVKEDESPDDFDVPVVEYIKSRPQHITVGLTARK